MTKRLKELIADKDGFLRERSGRKVDVYPVGFPIGLAIPGGFFLDKKRFDKRKTAAFIKNFLRLYQPQCVNIPGVSSRKYEHKIRDVDYYAVNLEGQIMGNSGDSAFNVKAKTSFDVGGREVTQYEEQETLHHLGAIQFYRAR